MVALEAMSSLLAWKTLAGERKGCKRKHVEYCEHECTASPAMEVKLLHTQVLCCLTRRLLKPAAPCVWGLQAVQ